MSWRTVLPTGAGTGRAVARIRAPFALPFANVPLIVYSPGGRSNDASWPSLTVRVATLAPVARSRTVIVPAHGLSGRNAHLGEENRTSGPPTRNSPLTNRVGPALTIG